MTRVLSPSLDIITTNTVLLGEVLASLINCDPLVRLDLLLHDGLCALEVEDQLASGSVSEKDAHALGLRTEWEVRKH